jgi:DNA-binding NarL/FixJ family response regulator
MMVQTIEKYTSRSVQYERSDEQDQGDEKEQAVQVMILDAHLLMREALRRVIESFSQVSVYASLNQVQDMQSMLKRGKTDVLLLGSSLAVSDCLEYVKMAQQIQASLGIVVLRQQLCPETALPLIKSGIQSLLGEEASEKDLARAIMAAATGSTFLGQGARDILNGYVSRSPLHFTEREMQILPLLRLGSSNFCIAQQLGLKEKTVEKHLTHIYEKLHIRSRTEAVLRIQTLHI